MRNKELRNVTLGAMVAALYVLLTVLSNAFGLANGAVQLRLSEMLCVLPAFFPAAIPGLYLGCMVANFLTSAAIFDVFFGSIATLLGAIGTCLLRRRPILSLLPPILSNTVIVPIVLVVAYGLPATVPSILLSALTVCIGEMLSCGSLGFFLMKVIKKYLIYTK
ncbi:MAG: QueT transporter family protein [Clostridia bacterium]|nr:QueT transporter family protein [Clostridia bacterium]